MGKIRVEDLAQMMGIANQDLIFKLKSIGVRLEEENPTIDSEVIEAVLQGKALRHPREVILRDKEAEEAAARTAPVAPRRRPTPGRLPVPARRPPRRRSLIQRVEPRIRTIPTAEPAKPVEPTPQAAPPTKARPEAAPVTAASESAAPAPTADEAGAERGKRPTRDWEEAKGKREKKTRGPKEPDLRSLRGGGAADIEEEMEAGEELSRPTAVSGRRKRRVQRRKDEADGGTVPFRQAAPAGPVIVSEGMTVRDFAEKLGVKAKDLISSLFERGVVVTINQVLDTEMALGVAKGLGVEAMVATFEEEVQLLQDQKEDTPKGRDPRAPVVTIMGHVDHGKTTLLDAIRSSKITESEFGGITQHIGAYQVETNGKRVVFLDTPGHEAFTLMRARGAKVTDIVVLVVAADDGVMPQTVEAIDHAKAARVPILVAINKIDKSNANVDRVKKDLSDHGLMVEDWGGDIVAIGLSALKGQGIPELLEMIQLTADLRELRANTELPGQGVVLEARKEAGRGVVATVLVQDGTVRIGDIFVSGAAWGRVRSMNDDEGHKIQLAGPSTPVEITGFDTVPDAGDTFQVVEEEAKARSVAEFRQQEQRRKDLAPTPSKLSLERLFSQIEEGEVKELRVVLKADVQGSVEVLSQTLRKLSTPKVSVEVIHAGAGAITTNDVILASASNAIVIGFNVRPERNAAELASREEVDVRLHTVIYEISDEVKKAMTGLLEPTFREVTKGRAEVREIFSIPRHGVVAGCHIVEGTVPRDAQARLLRDNVVVHEGTIASLRRFKDDVAEVRTGFDCGIRLERYQDVKPGDMIEAFVKEEVAQTL